MNTIKTTHVGSLPRPAEMAMKILRKQAITDSDMQTYLTDVIERQLALGIAYINNGELPRTDYVQSTTSRISGFDASGDAPVPLDLEEMPELSRRFNSKNGLITLNPKAPVTLPACSGPLAYTGETSLRNELEMMAQTFNTLKQAHPDSTAELFFTAPSPGTVALFLENQFYPSDEAYLEHLGAVMKREYDIIAGFGFHLQIDCPDLAMGRHTRYSRLNENDFLSRIDMNIDALNQALLNVDSNRCRVHVCWGNYSGTHHRDIGLKEIFTHIVRVKAGSISLESANHRHAHEWTLFNELSFPEDKVLLPGVIDTSSNTVEHPDLVAQRICNFADILGPHRVIASTDCGFATTATAASVSGEAAWMKLASLVEGARRAEMRYN